MTIERFKPREIPGKPWGQELLVAASSLYTGKVLTMKAGHRGGLQYHVTKDEAFYLVSGQVQVRHDDGHGLIWTLMKPGESYRIPPGAVHQVEAIEDSVLFEVSTPVFDDRVNVGATYGVTDGEAQ